ncbi:MAG: LD-carboxypeptidase [Bacteroidales bacterium]|nr:LD-carboxypeptidase [Bacteroidales bacterium]
MRPPPPLKKGDRVAVVSPAGKVNRTNVEQSARTLEIWGLEVVFGQSVFHASFSFAGTDSERLADFQAALDDPSVRAIFCARGGYGSVRIIDNLNFSLFEQFPKWIAGFSDITVFHAHIQSNYGIQSIHGPMPNSLFKEGDEHIGCLRSILFGGAISPVVAIAEENQNRPGVCRGVLTGGNLAVLCSLAGTPSDIRTEGKILFLEEVGEHLYRIDRMIYSLKRSGKLAGLAGLVAGAFTEIPDTAIDFGLSAQKIIMEAVQEYGYPVAFGFPAGHIERNMPLILGREANLVVTETAAELGYPLPA